MEQLNFFPKGIHDQVDIIGVREFLIGIGQTIPINITLTIPGLITIIEHQLMRHQLRQYSRQPDIMHVGFLSDDGIEHFDELFVLDEGFPWGDGVNGLELHCGVVVIDDLVLEQALDGVDQFEELGDLVASAYGL